MPVVSCVDIDLFFINIRSLDYASLRSTVVCGFSFASPRKASIKEFHQFAMLTVTIPLDIRGVFCLLFS